jgi:hypothetical protein
VKPDYKFLFIAVAFCLSATASQARDLTNEETDKIVAALSADKCELEIANLVGTNYEVSAACADGRSYTYILDKDFKVLEKKPANN